VAEESSSARRLVARAAALVVATAAVVATQAVPTGPIPANLATPKPALNAPRATTVLPAKTGVQGKTASHARTANLGPTPIWAAFGSAIRARAVPPLAASPIRCAPASTRCAVATAAKAAQGDRAETGAVAQVATAVAGVKRIHCAPALVAYADWASPLPFAHPV